MRIIIDADACPKAVKEVIYRAAERNRIQLVLVANTHIRTPPSPLFTSITVRGEIDSADDHIVKIVESGDLVITADIPLAQRIIEKNGIALDPRGELFTEENINARVTIRNFMQELRENGVAAGGPSPITARDIQRFANELNLFLKTKDKPQE
jgi:uncharacterized protein